MLLAAVKWSAFVPLVALAFTVASFWWIYLRRGRLRATEPTSYTCFFQPGTVRIRMPLVIFNTGAAAIAVEDLRLVVEGHPVDWLTSRRTVRPWGADMLDAAAPFAIDGRKAVQVIAEFGANEVPWTPKEQGSQKVQVERKTGLRWKSLVAFDWWPPKRLDDWAGVYRNRETDQTPEALGH